MSQEITLLVESALSADVAKAAAREARKLAAKRTTLTNRTLTDGEYVYRGGLSRQAWRAKLRAIAKAERYTAWCREQRLAPMQCVYVPPEQRGFDKDQRNFDRIWQMGYSRFVTRDGFPTELYTRAQTEGLL